MFFKIRDLLKKRRREKRTTRKSMSKRNTTGKSNPYKGMLLEVFKGLG
jgi:hypothetical protein